MKSKIRELNPEGRKKPFGVFSRFSEFENLLSNAIRIESDDGETPIDFVAETFAKRALIERGAVGYDKITKRFYYVYGEGIDEYGNPTQLVLITANGKSYARKASYGDDPDGAYIIKAYPFEFSLAAMIRETTDFMANCDIAMRQNLEACKTPYVVICRDDSLRLSFAQALQQKQLGQAALIVSPELGEGLKAVDVSAPYLVDKFAFARDMERDALLNKLGILTSNLNKRERVQSAEVNATLGQASDYIYLLIDTFNNQMKSYGLPFKMSFNGSMEEIYLAEETEVNDVETRGVIENGN